ncbi:alpha-mannosyltransferase KNAG_0G01070 [Huiozyma naganishii CBS 8797]|uniref:Glycosyltransferase family 71 protein n=1 Tax=Huiozyma naganishii (strain ATCC MYA-139 / BCRC 22969 / CBS 8797 / KCTC 17520 / NBRC 10181 / NCYC 3082 / Yp74L-3) TaxID=1071383 RepID=J7R8G5_HUIN7|nr:hypothetical protein KNAG_0G01070 [Kazachstania naganishii CBS 8797]CCK71165.1 hypothetical protein KNAG_0G01070 [Kazachstania naganishii CBS 8797]
MILSRSLRWRRQNARRVLLLALLGLLIVYLSHDNTPGRNATRPVIAGDYDNATSPYHGFFQGSTFKNDIGSKDSENILSNIRSASPQSPFALIAKHVGEDKFRRMAKSKKCQLLMKTVLEQGSGLDQSTLPISVEIMRIYAYCFLGDDPLYPWDMLDESTPEETLATTTRFTKLVFPFLETGDFDTQILWPLVYDLSQKGEYLEDLLLSVPELDGVIIQNNFNFWINWSQAASGRGVVITMGDNDVDMFGRLVRVLENLENDIPIQVVTTGKEMKPQFIQQLREYTVQTGQRIQLVDSSPMLDRLYVAFKITRFLNKWVATIFNTFEEAILIDVDSIPFVPLSTFFEIESYKTTGIYMYRDRDIKHEHAPEKCIADFRNLEPSVQETDLIGTSLRFDLSQSNDLQRQQQNGESITIEEVIYKNFFHNYNLHQVDSGLVVINKHKQLHSLLLAFQLHLSGVFEKCVHGDKEFFWLGPLLSGVDYTIDPLGSSVIGQFYEDNGKTGICAPQMSHLNDFDQLMWTNGGLKICKFKGAAANDFDKYPDFFTNRYSTVDNLDSIYNSPLAIEGAIVPDPESLPWMQTRECQQFRFCAYAVSDESGGNTVGKRVIFNPVDAAKYNEISFVWNNPAFVS